MSSTSHNIRPGGLSQIPFEKINKDAYSVLSQDNIKPDTIYFIEDGPYIMYNGIKYGDLDGIDLSNFVNKENAIVDAEYDDASKNINFKNSDGTIIKSIDVTPFIKDGMLDNVLIEDSKLKLIFNTESGKSTIELPISDIFNAANYYTKEQIDEFLENTLATKTEINDLETKLKKLINEKVDNDKHIVSIENSNNTLTFTFNDDSVLTVSLPVPVEKTFKTINGESIEGSGNIEISSSNSSDIKIKSINRIPLIGEGNVRLPMRYNDNGKNGIESNIAKSSDLDDTTKVAWKKAYGNENMTDAELDTFIDADRPQATGDDAFAANWGTKASSNNSFAVNQNSTAAGNASFACGLKTSAHGANSCSFNNSTTAVGANSAAFGFRTYVSGENSFGAGKSSVINGDNSVAIGQNNRISANIIAIGKDNNASVDSILIGEGLRTLRFPGTVFGKFNKLSPREKKKFAIGVGTSNTDRKDALWVDDADKFYIDGIELSLQETILNLQEEIVALRRLINNK